MDNYVQAIIHWCGRNQSSATVFFFFKIAFSGDYLSTIVNKYVDNLCNRLLRAVNNPCKERDEIGEQQ